MMCGGALPGCCLRLLPAPSLVQLPCAALLLAMAPSEGLGASAMKVGSVAAAATKPGSCAADAARGDSFAAGAAVGSCAADAAKVGSCAAGCC